MRRALRLLGSLMIVAGVATLAWSLVVWRWEDPFTSLYTAYEQRELADGLDERIEGWRDTGASTIADARTYRRDAERGDAIGRIVVPRLGLRMVFVFGTDTESLKRGPGLDPRTFFPGQRHLVYIAGHRTTYSAPFSHIDRLKRGDVVRLEMPYGTFTYSVTRSIIVPSTQVSVLRSRGREEVALQACHPRFFASHRWITYARLAGVAPPRGEGSEATG
ncbi:MAG TPA: class E sortase [Gaiellaceae bacterium]|nr:class E sortase [Gaiellaceae bacterium]